MNYHLAAVRGQHVPRAVLDRGALEQLRIDKVRNDLDRALDLKFSDSLLVKVTADRGHPIRALDAETGDRFEARLRPDQGDIRAVKSGDDLDRMVPAQHFLGDPGARGVRDRIMDVQQVEAVFLGDRMHFYRQGQRIGLVLEQGVARNLDLVKINIAVKAFQTVRQGVRDEMYLMPLQRQLLTQLGGQYSAASESRVTGDSDP